MENNDNEQQFNSFSSGERGFSSNKVEAQIDEYSTSLSGALDANDSYDKEVQEQAESANEESYYNTKIDDEN